VKQQQEPKSTKLKDIRGEERFFGTGGHGGRSAKKRGYSNGSIVHRAIIGQMCAKTQIRGGR